VEAQKLAKLTKMGSEMRVHLSKKGRQLKQEKKVSYRTAGICAYPQIPTVKTKYGRGATIGETRVNQKKQKSGHDSQ
jgi:ribosomal protein L13E